MEISKLRFVIDKLIDKSKSKSIAWKIEGADMYTYQNAGIKYTVHKVNYGNKVVASLRIQKIDDIKKTIDLNTFLESNVIFCKIQELYNYLEEENKNTSLEWLDVKSI